MLDAVARDPDVRWQQRFENFNKAFAQLAKAAALAEQRTLTDLEQQGLIQAFEFTHELAWKTLKDYLALTGSTARLHGSRDATREAFSLGLLHDGNAWMRMIDHRNETTHTYDEKTANEIAAAILNSYVAEFGKVQAELERIARADA